MNTYFNKKDVMRELQVAFLGLSNERYKIAKKMFENIEEANVVEIPQTGIDDLSDGYHTFNQLYYQRAILFATIVNQNLDISWKSYKHEDGQYCFDSDGEWFIVGIDTPEGSYTYHYEKKYWDYFKCQELERGKHWDGHAEEDVTRLLSLTSERETIHGETEHDISGCN